MKILIVDDESINRTLLANMLYNAGYKDCVEAANGVDAIELFVEEKPDLVLLLSGTARIEVPMDGKYARLERGPGFLGEIGFLRACCTWTTDRESTFRATGDVFITPGSTYLYWESEQLRRAVAENEWLHRAIIALIALTLANKLTDDYRAPEPLPTRLRSRAQAKHSSKLDA